MFTAKEENRPIMTLRPVRAEYAVFIYDDERPTTLCDNGSPEEEGEEGRGYDDSLDKEENSKFLDWHESQTSLDEPVQKDTEQTSGF
jgi:hypothetical protein